MQSKEGSEVTVRSKKAVEYRRNSSFVKRYNQPENTKELTENTSEEPVSPTVTSSTLEESVATLRPQRTINMPQKYKDYALYQLDPVGT